MKIFCSPDSMKYYKSILISSLLILSFPILNAQTNNPNSKYGIGDAVSTQNIMHLGMGGVCIADLSPYNINYNNPASYANIGLSTIQIAMRTNRSKLTNSTTLNTVTGSFDMHYINFGLPLSKNTGLSFGLMPISKVFYRLQSEYIAFDTTLIYNLSAADGNYQNIYVGLGHKYKGLAFGANLYYTFGSKNLRTLNNFGALPILTAEYQKNQSGGGIGTNLGLQYTKELKKNKNIRFGATYNPAYNLKTKTDIRYVSTWQSTEIDTASSVSELPGKIKMPSTMAFGFGAKLNDKINLGLDYSGTQWGNYRENNLPDSLTNSYRLALGVNYIPDVNAPLNYWKHVEYRLGFYRGQEYVKLNNNAMPIMALTAGMSFPMRRTRDALGALHTSFEVGSRGTNTNNSIKDNFTRFQIGLTMNAKWFKHTKYD
jgi:hypothetical protein